MRAGQSIAPREAPVEVWITPTVERDYERRNVFPSLRIKQASRIVNGATGVYFVSIEEAEDVFKNAAEQRENRASPRGVPKAFSSLAERLRDTVKHAKGLWDDPGIDVAKQRMQESPARFKVGEWVRYWSPWVDDDDDGHRMQIVEGYDLYPVGCEDGSFVNEDGGRFSYKWGYTARRPGGDTNFYPPYELQRLDYSRGHLRLVETRPAPTHRAMTTASH